MSTRDERQAEAARRIWRRPMVGRGRDEEHRASTPLEAFFDLCFVVAVAQAAGQLHHAIAEGQVLSGLLGYAAVFFAIWWAWMNFTWFASAYDTDDVLYRIASFVQIAGALVLAAGVPQAFEGNYVIVTVGYLVMRTALTSQWLRASHEDPGRRRAARRYALGVAVLQLGWIAKLTLGGSWAPGIAFIVLVPLELSVPVWAERKTALNWHPGHIAERYGLFTLIVLGESVAAATTAVQSAVQSGQALGRLLTIAAGGLLIVGSMWWLYFEQRAAERLSGTSFASFYWGYGHYVIFASAAAVGAGLQVAVDHDAGRVHLADWGANAAVAVPVALYLLSVWLLQSGSEPRSPRREAYLVAAALVLCAVAFGQAVPVIGLLVAALVAFRLVTAARATRQGGL